MLLLSGVFWGEERLFFVKSIIEFEILSSKNGVANPDQRKDGAYWVVQQAI